MGVKDLVQSYESLSMDPAHPSSPAPSLTPSSGPEERQTGSQRSRQSNVPRTPRFQRHPLLTTFTTPSRESRHDDDTLSLHTLPDRDSLHESPTEDEDSDRMSKTLVDTEATHSSASLSRQPTFLERKTLASDSSPTAVPFTLDHNPVPASEVFSRHSAPLYLPKLDQYLEKLPSPIFNKPGQETSTIFPPMHLLDPLKRTLDDLESNAKASPWYDRKNVMGSIVGVVLGFTGSSALASYYSLQGMINTIQIFALLLSTLLPLDDGSTKDEWRELLLGTIPNILAFNFASTIVQALIFLLVFMTITFALLFYFYRSTCSCDRYSRVEGLQKSGSQSRQWGLMLATFLLNVLYLPLSTMAVHVLVWSEDLWVVPNPYKNETSFPPYVPPLGPPSEFRDPLDFCWTTTMKKNEINFSPVVIILSLVVVAGLTIWFPIALRRAILKSVPTIDRYTELGRLRSPVDKDIEYRRLLSRDQNPFAFLYLGYRRGWGTYQSTYLFAKLSTLVIVAVIDSDNCLFRSVARSVVPIVRQVLLLTAMVGLFIVQCVFTPFLDPVNNASEWTSRLNYVLTSLVSLLVALNVPGKEVFNTVVLYTVYASTYGLSYYFMLITMGWAQRLVKRTTGRLDFSVDVFSPKLDVTSSSVHTKRRIWQESISTLILTNSVCAIPKTQRMVFAQSRNSLFPPYLLAFQGSPGERHVENLKILREVGNMEYKKAVALLSGPDYERYKRLEDEIREHYTGPDSFWRPPGSKMYRSFFGNAWWIPFPPTLVMRYDEGRYAVLQSVADLELYIEQNSSLEARRRRQIRMSLRALEGMTVHWPYEHITPVGSQSVWSCRKRWKAQISVQYQSCVLKIKRQGHLEWNGLSLGSGFDVQLAYDKEVAVDGTVIGLTEDFSLTSPLARFLEVNQRLIFARIARIEEAVETYRKHHHQECIDKANVLSYGFLSDVYDHPKDSADVLKSCLSRERDSRVRKVFEDNQPVLDAMYERFSAVSNSETRTWWYLFWDDLWRRNHDAIKQLSTYATDFNPYYHSSIAYTPLPRPALEAFLAQRGLFVRKQSKINPPYFHSGLLNKIYLRLNETVFRGSSKAVMFHVGDNDQEMEMGTVDAETRFDYRPSSLGTGGGTDHDIASIIVRPNYRWEIMLNDPQSGFQQTSMRFWCKLGTWMGITPVWIERMPTQPVSVDVRLDKGRYILLDHS